MELSRKDEEDGVIPYEGLDKNRIIQSVSTINEPGAIASKWFPFKKYNLNFDNFF